MAADNVRAVLRDYYDAQLRAAGPTPRGADWDSAESQELRFAQLLRSLPLIGDRTLLDYGCGYGALCDFMRARGLGAHYTGFDISAAMITEAKRLHASDPHCTFTSLPNTLASADYVVASGIFNVRLAVDDDEWNRYVQEEVLRMAELANVGIAFGVLSTYSDPEKQRDYLYYADPLAWFDFCKRHIGAAVVLLHDDPVFEFTLGATKGW